MELTGAVILHLTDERAEAWGREEGVGVEPPRVLRETKYNLVLLTLNLSPQNSS